MNITTKIAMGTLVVVTFILLLLFVTGFKLQSVSGLYVYNPTGTPYTVAFINSNDNSFTYCSEGTFTINPGEAIYVSNYNNQQINVYNGNTFVALLETPSSGNVAVLGNETVSSKPSSISQVSLSSCTPPDYVTVFTQRVGSLPILTSNITFGYQCNACINGTGSCGSFSNAVPNNSQETFSNLPYCTTGILSGGLFQYGYKKSSFTFTCKPPSVSSGAYSYSTTLSGEQKTIPTVATKGNYTVTITFENCVSGTQYSALYGSSSKTCTCSNGSCSVTITTGHPSEVEIILSGQNIPTYQFDFYSNYISNTCTLYKCTFNYTQNGQSYTGTTYQTSPCPSGNSQTTITISAGQTVTYPITYRAENAVDYINGLFTGNISSLAPVSYVPTMGGTYTGTTL